MEGGKKVLGVFGGRMVETGWRRGCVWSFAHDGGTPPPLGGKSIGVLSRGAWHSCRKKGSSWGQDVPTTWSVGWRCMDTCRALLHFSTSPLLHFSTSPLLHLSTSPPLTSHLSPLTSPCSPLHAHHPPLRRTKRGTGNEEQGTKDEERPLTPAQCWPGAWS